MSDTAPDLQPPGQEPRNAPVHTIPEQYYLGPKQNAGSKKLVIALIILVVAALGLGAAYVFTRVINQNESQNQTPTNTLFNVSNQNSNITLNMNSVNTNVTNGGTGLNSNNSNTNGAGNFNFNVNGATNQLFNGNSNGNTNQLNINVVRIPDSTDADKDGLTDVEEILYGTAGSIADTDSDGFRDGEEVIHGYSPRGVGKLLDTNLAKEYLHPSFGYKVLYPSTWIRSADPQNEDGILFTTASGEFIGVSVQSNPARLAARDWYLKASPGIDIRKIQSVANNTGVLQGAISLDEQTVYYTSGDRAYVITYSTNLLTAANYRTTFEMMYRSFELSSVLTNTNTNVNTNSNTNNSNTN